LHILFKNVFCLQNKYSMACYKDPPFLENHCSAVIDTHLSLHKHVIFLYII
jgi:hypothetical protein